MESYGIIIFDYSEESDIDNFKETLNNAAKEVAKESSFDVDYCTLHIEQEYKESDQCIMQYVGSTMAHDTLITLFKMLSMHNIAFARANDTGDEDPMLNLYFLDNGTFSFQPLWDADINMAEERMLDNGEFFQKELETKGALYYEEGFDKWMSGIKIAPEHKLIHHYATSIKNSLIEMYN